MRPGQDELLETVNDFVAKNTANGELNKLYQKWLGARCRTSRRSRSKPHDRKGAAHDRVNVRTRAAPRTDHPHRGVNKWYGSFQVLTDIDLSVRTGASAS